MRIGIGRRPMAVDGHTPLLRAAPCASHRAMQKRTIPRGDTGGVMHAVNRSDALALIEVMSKRRDCD
ncbi:hypothetical protein [Burkholderia contaminans]|uniref:hypothetical protein n=1 Tax=Burkholderia contaminans TaxID=488447 RepID=UPI001588620A|nr:hypothetical protein [Burkholderia contaminans]